MSNFLHGLEVIEIDVGGRIIVTPSTSIIAVVGTSSGDTLDEAKFPINTPVRITNIKDLAYLGTEGTLYNSLQSIYKQTSPVCVVIRTEEGIDISTTISNIAGNEVEMSGVYAILKSNSILGLNPKILCTPYYSGVTEDGTPNSIVTNLLQISEKLRAVAIIDAPNTTKEEAETFALQIGSSRAYIIDPAYKGTFSESFIASSPLVCGVIARVDATVGFWNSPSNKIINGVIGLNRPIDFGISDPTSEANILNSKGIGTIVFSGGNYKLWGNRSPSQDNKWHYLSVRRIVDTVYDAIEQNMEWANDKNFSKNLFSDIENNLQDYLNSLIKAGALLGGQVWVSEDNNTIETYTNGQLIVEFDLEPPVPVERLTFKAYRNSEYIEELFKQA